MVTVIVLIKAETSRIPDRADQVTGLAGTEPGLD